MTIEISYSHLRMQLSSVFDRVCDDREIFIVRRRGRKNVGILAADELARITEAARLHSSVKPSRAAKKRANAN